MPVVSVGGNPSIRGHWELSNMPRVGFEPKLSQTVKMYELFRYIVHRVVKMIKITPVSYTSSVSMKPYTYVRIGVVGK